MLRIRTVSVLGYYHFSNSIFKYLKSETNTLGSFWKLLTAMTFRGHSGLFSQCEVWLMLVKGSCLGFTYLNSLGPKIFLPFYEISYLCGYVSTLRNSSVIVESDNKGKQLNTVLPFLLSTIVVYLVKRLDHGDLFFLKQKQKLFLIYCQVLPFTKQIYQALIYMMFHLAVFCRFSSKLELV